MLLQGGDETTLRLWRILVEQSKTYFLAVYERLGVRLASEDFAGESTYNDQLPAVVDELDQLGLLQESHGAQYVFPSGFVNRDGDPMPIIVRKSDGGFGYGTTDLATIRHRIRTLQAERLLYVVGLPQAQHLEMVFQTARDAGWLAQPTRAEHVGHGSILGPDGKILRTRAGESVKLLDLLTDAVRKAAAIVEEKNPDLDDATRAEVAHAVGIGAVKYADLSTDRNKDYNFDYDRMLAFDGNTAPYLQYARARICSIFRRSAERPPTGLEQIAVTKTSERALALQLLAFVDVVGEVEETLEFHKLATYLYTLATAFSRFYEQCPVLRATGDVRRSRLALCDLTARTLHIGLGLLGIESRDAM